MSHPEILLDTNVLIYAIDTQSQFYERSRDFVFGREGEPAITSISLSEAYSVLTRKQGYGLPTTQADEIIQWYRARIPVLYPNKSSSDWLHYLVKNYSPRGHHIFDMEIAALGLANGIQTIATKNEKDFRVIREVEVVW